MSESPRILFLNNAIHPDVYKPFEHWRGFVPARIEMVEVALGQPMPPLEGFTHLLVSGSEASIVEPDTWVIEQVALIRKAAGKGLAILGSCHGHQMLAVAMGGRVGRAARPELGWIPLEVDAGDPMLEGAEEPVRVFSSHFDEVTGLPAKFVVPARSADCAIHAFRHPELPIWGLQSHPEIDIPNGEKLLSDFAAIDPRVREVLFHRPAQDSGLIRTAVGNFLRAGQ